jgi:small subunit ribosomal protein S20
MAEEKAKKQKKPTAIKRQLQDQKKRLLRRMFKSQVSTYIRKLKDGIKNKEGKEQLQEKLNKVYSLVDKGTKKKIFKKNKASRIKSRLTTKI